MATKQRRDTHTIQLWPSGRSVEYYGDSADGEYNQAGGFKARHPRRRGLRYTRPDNDRAILFRPGTPAEWREIRINERAAMYADRYIWHCDSSLVDDLIKASGSGHCELGGFEIDDIENVYTNCSDADATWLREYAGDQGIDLPEVPTVDCAACEGTGDAPTDPAGDPVSDRCAECNGTGNKPDPDADDDDNPRGWLTEAREVCTEHAQENPAEVYEWWRVDGWLCARLREIGEVVIDNDYGEWWGRTCTGQQYIMDGVLQRIARGQDQDQTEYGNEREEQSA